MFIIGKVERDTNTSTLISAPGDVDDGGEMQRSFLLCLITVALGVTAAGAESPVGLRPKELTPLTLNLCPNQEFPYSSCSSNAIVFNGRKTNGVFRKGGVLFQSAKVLAANSDANTVTLSVAKRSYEIGSDRQCVFIQLRPCPAAATYSVD